jgi:iron complex transport system permease protein
MEAIGACAAAAGLLVLLPLAARWLDILPLGEEVSQALGVGLQNSRLLVLSLAGALSAAATLIVGPFGFVGLMAPHIARSLGLRRATPHLLGSAALGGLIMVAADWLARNALFPYQLPAGLLAALLGGPYFMWLMRRPATPQSAI